MKKFRHAFNGMYYAVGNELSMRTHGLMMGVAIIAGFYFEITPTQWVLQLVLFALVIGFEMINTALERLTDTIYPDWNAQAKVIKDVAAGAVLFSAIIAFLAGIIIYLPKILSL